MTQPATLADLRNTEWSEPRMHLRSVKDEMRHNLICMLEAEQEIFPGIIEAGTTARGFSMCSRCQTSVYFPPIRCKSGPVRLEPHKNGRS